MAVKIPAIKIALAQMDIVPGMIDKNLNNMLRFIDEAKDQGVDLIAFPELCISGYLISDKWYDDAFCRDVMAANSELLTASNGIAVAYGNIYSDENINARIGDSLHHPNKDGRTRKYNCAVVVQDGRYAKRANETPLLPEGHQPKTLFPNYRFFDDERYYYSLHEIATDFGTSLAELAHPFLISAGGTEVSVGFEICEDLWCEDYREQHRAMNVTRHLINNGSELIVNLSASPWTIGKHRSRDRKLKFLKDDVDNHFVPFLYVNNVGAQNNGKNIITFDGGTTAYNTDGEPTVMVSHSFREELLIVKEASYKKVRGRVTASTIEQKYEAIRTGIGHIRNMNGWDEHPNFLVGLSGGVDSALVAALVCSVIGPDKMLTVNMPSQYNSEQTIAAAKTVASNLGIRHLEILIEELAETSKNIFNKLDSELESPEWMKSLSDENIQAKIRGTSILSNLAGRYGYLFTNNGNKLETALGYATLYGDVGGAIAPIADLTKAEVFEMCRFVNKKANREIIPEKLLPDELFRFDDDKIQPSAELKQDQVDPMKFGYHCALLTAFTRFIRITPEDICQWYLEGKLHSNLKIEVTLMQRWGITDPKTFIDDLDWFVNATRKSVFKRIQSPPIVVTSTSAYGYDIRESQLPEHRTREHSELINSVLNLNSYPA